MQIHVASTTLEDDKRNPSLTAKSGKSFTGAIGSNYCDSWIQGVWEPSRAGIAAMLYEKHMPEVISKPSTRST